MDCASVTSFAAGNSVKGRAEHETPILHNSYKRDIGDAVDATKLLDDFLVQLTVSVKKKKKTTTTTLKLAKIYINFLLLILLYPFILAYLLCFCFHSNFEI